jgi:tetratricopeptide (TPR) repeat protein
MFFPRLRRQAKWMFVFLALVFALGFVIFGVGSNIGGAGLGDIISDLGARSNLPSVGDAEKRVDEHPRDPQAYRELADALRANDRNEEAIAPLERYLDFRPRDVEVLRELATIYGIKTERLQAQAQQAQLNVQEFSGGPFVPAPTSELGRALGPGRISQAFTQEANERLSRLFGQLQASARKEMQIYGRLVKLVPDEPDLQIQLATAAEKAGDVPRAIKAYKRFVQLVPDDPTVGAVKERIKFLQR